jgi:hypothetical protein
MTIEEQLQREIENRSRHREQIITLCTLAIYESTRQVLSARDLYASSEKDDAERWPEYVRDVLQYVWDSNDVEKIDYTYLWQLINLVEETDKIAELMSLTLSMSALALLPENLIEDMGIDDFFEMMDCECCQQAFEVFTLHWLIEDEPMSFEAIRALTDNGYAWEFINMLMLDAQGLHDGNFSFPRKVAA